MVCPQCHTENAEGHRFCLRCGAPLVAPAVEAQPATAAAAVRSTPSPGPTFVRPPGTSATLVVVLVGAFVAGLIFLMVIAGGAYFMIKASATAHGGAAGLQPSAPAPSQPAAPPQGPAQPQPLTPPQGPAQPQPLTPPQGPTPTPPAGPGGGVAPAAPENVQMQPYQDPQGQFSIEYPQGWQVKAEDNGFTIFYKDDPEEGTALGVWPRGSLPGQVGAEQFLETVVQQLRQQYPDFQVTQRTVKPPPNSNQGQVVTASAEWTNHHGERMGTLLQYRIGPAGDGNTGVVVIAWQAPLVAMKSASAVLYEMYRSFKQL